MKFPIEKPLLIRAFIGILFARLMMKDLIKTVKLFLKEHYIENKPILIGYSGGFDSKALLHLLLSCQKEFHLNIHLAHVNHGWREESGAEAKVLQKEAESLNLPFHLKKLTDLKRSNLEGFCRQLRLEFFYKLYTRLGCMALVLGHQADDVAETVLKRFLEGAHFPYLGGMQPVVKFEKLTIWRPLIGISKKEIISWLRENKIEAVDDYTNRSTLYLRGRMREKIIPQLSRAFGKNVTNNLYHAALRSWELKSYFDKKVEMAYLNRQRGPFGVFVDFNKLQEMEVVEKSYLIKKISSEEKVNISRDNIEKCLHWLDTKRSNIRLVFKNCFIFVDRGYLFFVKKGFEKFSGKIAIKKGVCRVGIWRLEVRTQKKGDLWGGWKDLWRRQSTIFLPKGEYSLALAKYANLYGKKRLKVWWQSNKVPSFFRYIVPVVYKEDRVCGEFLTGKIMSKQFNSDSFLKISLLTG